MSAALEFLMDLFETGLSYSSINTARSALSTIVTFPNGESLGKHPLISRFLRGVFVMRPSFPRYQSIWDASVVLRSFDSMESNSQLSLRHLSYKAVTLLALLTAQRVQTLHVLMLDDIVLTDTECHIAVRRLLKQTRPGRHLSEIVLPAFPSNKNVCVVEVLHEYVARTSPLRGTAQTMFISYRKPHKAVSRDTLSRWIKHTLSNAGVDQSVFKAHSVRAAATSAASTCGVPLQTILATAGWSGSSTFARFYNKPVANAPAFSTTLQQTVV